VVAAVEPLAVLLKYGFLIVLYLFLLWVARSVLKDLRRVRETAAPGSAAAVPGVAPDATGIHLAAGVDARLVVERAPGHTPGMEYEIAEGAVLGRGDQAEIRLDDPFASSRHARLTRQGRVIVLEDLASTNGTYLNEELLGGPAPLHSGDRVRIGDSEFTFMES
jgi:pSer/pThr/pTyr-binding forkhead associated (FHA) protein